MMINIATSLHAATMRYTKHLVSSTWLLVILHEVVIQVQLKSVL